MVPRRLAVLTLLALTCGGCAGAEDPPAERPAQDDPAATPVPPGPNAGIPREPEALAERLTATHRDLDSAIERWRADGDAGSRRPPRDVTLYALHEQRIHLLLAKRRGLAARVLVRIPGRIAAHVRATLRAKRELSALYVPVRRTHWRTGPAAPAVKLMAHYREARRRFGVQVHVLAAVNFVESAFGRLRNTSTAGAQGPMQFIPSTWAAYGMGGNVRDPRDAILGAANYLRASGAPGNVRAALYAYNPSSRYVNAVLAYANRIRRDVRAFFSYYAWQVYVRSTEGTRRITGPGT